MNMKREAPSVTSSSRRLRNLFTLRRPEMAQSKTKRVSDTTALPTLEDHPRIKAAEARLTERIAALKGLQQQQDERRRELERLQNQLATDEANWMRGDVSEAALARLRQQIATTETEITRGPTAAYISSRIADAQRQFDALKAEVFASDIWPAMKERYNDAAKQFGAAFAALVEANANLKDILDVLDGRVNVPVHPLPDFFTSPTLVGISRADHILKDLRDAGLPH